MDSAFTLFYQLLLKKTYSFEGQGAKPIPYLKPIWPKSIPYLSPKRLKNHTLQGHTYLHSPYTREYHPWGRTTDQTTRLSDILTQDGLKGTIDREKKQQTRALRLFNAYFLRRTRLQRSKEQRSSGEEELFQRALSTSWKVESNQRINGLLKTQKKKLLWRFGDF